MPPPQIVELAETADEPYARLLRLLRSLREAKEMEEPYMQNFFKELLEWVDQPPPPRGRDTHAISFALSQDPPNSTSPSIPRTGGY